MTTQLEAIRKQLGLTQMQMAERLGMSMRALPDIEAGTSKERTVHLQAAHSVSLRMAVQSNDASLATEEIRDLALRLARLIAPVSDKDPVVPRALADTLVEALSRSSS